MNKVKVVFWSGTGNTEAMANAVANGIKAAGAEAELLPFEAVSPSELSGDNVIAQCEDLGRQLAQA